MNSQAVAGEDWGEDASPLQPAANAVEGAACARIRPMALRGRKPAIGTHRAAVVLVVFR